MILAYLNNNASPVPFRGIRASLILDPYSVTNFEWGQGFSVFIPLVLMAHVTVAQCFLTSL